jgi:hypothetical protein
MSSPGKTIMSDSNGCITPKTKIPLSLVISICVLVASLALGWGKYQTAMDQKADISWVQERYWTRAEQSEYVTRRDQQFQQLLDNDRSIQDKLDRILEDRGLSKYTGR